MKCDLRDTGRTVHGDRALYVCSRPGCGRRVAVNPGKSPDSIWTQCKHPLLFAGGEVVHYLAKKLGFKECGPCRGRRAWMNERLSVPVPGWFYRLVRTVIGFEVVDASEITESHIAQIESAIAKTYGHADAVKHLRRNYREKVKEYSSRLRELQALRQELASLASDAGFRLVTYNRKARPGTRPAAKKETGG